MKKDSARLFGITVVITAAIVGGAYLLDRANRTGRPLPPEQATWTELTPSSRNDSSTPSSRNGQSPYPGSTGNPSTPTANVSAETSAEGIITCQHPDHGTVYTNAASCEEADLDNRISEAEPYQPASNPERYKNSDYQPPQDDDANR